MEAKEILKELEKLEETDPFNWFHLIKLVIEDLLEKIKRDIKLNR